MPYNLETYQEPFWAKSGNFVRGRDPLGVQNSSISLYATLLPGMTNLTLRLRYYGTYLFLLDEYHNLSEGDLFKKDTHGQYTFIRRAELILAFLMANKFPTELSVIGSNFSHENINEIKEIGYYDISSGADKLKDTKKGSLYWDYTSGALGQYYAGSLTALGLIQSRNGFFERTEDKGLELGNAYRNSLSKATTSLFLDRIREGKLYLEDLDNLVEIALNREYKNTPEGDFYLKTLLSDDGFKSKTASNRAAFQRKESLQIFLNLIQELDEPKEWLKLPLSAYERTLSNNKTVSEAAFGWYYYFLNELTHHSLEAVFWGLLMEMDRKVYSLPQFLTQMTKRVVEYCSKYLEEKIHLPLKDLVSILDLTDFQAIDLIQDIDTSVKNRNSFEGMGKGIFALLCLFRDNESKFQESKDYAVEHFLESKHGNALAIFDTYIESNNELQFVDFVEKLIHTLLNEHIAVAYNKMGNGEKNLLKFVIEDNYMIHIETMEPNFTNPRLKTLYNFTRDLDLVNEENHLTEAGMEMLNQLNQ